MRRPKWIWALVLALVIAAVFAALGQWQLSRAVTSNGPNQNATTEVAKSLPDIAAPGVAVSESQDGQMVTVVGALVSPDFTIVANRLNAGTLGYWVVGRFDVTASASAASPASVAVALGWSADRSQAETAARQLNQTPTFPSEELTGRYVGSDGPEIKDSQDKAAADRVMSTMAIPALINTWVDFPDTTAVYGGYIVASAPPAGLAAIDSPVPQRTTELNWLNIFYAVEWVIFAGFAIFFWYRLVRDAWERETEEAEVELTHAT
ncbi:hypothetical protein B7R25_12255 [Subtercola boreus]|uniref:SURF1-like protein n=2 Tax=Subtercola boreus TaxID=120213 RepID=A0A3E0W8H5_9MICO|nr:hypothetical protein B7R24_12155 [Subtercola boreus]RFA19763.1 hypothetical protein B7R23_12135 [Subtercola boreus]RFA26130.1 hypothetical protein B7R25_12255 [Subtercola boreus]